MLIVLSVPSKDDTYYQKHFTKMIEFYIMFAKEIHEKDNVIVLADKRTMPYMTQNLPNNILLTISEKLDPWIRDVSPVMPEKSIQFKYSGGLKSKEAKYLQKQFNSFVDKYSINYSKENFINDGGNFVHNGKDCLITTDKFLKLNKLNEFEAISMLKDIFKVNYVAILPADEEKLGHIDGMCAFLDEKILFLVKYDDVEYRQRVKAALDKYMPDDIQIIEIQCGVSEAIAKGGFASAYGLYVNCVPTSDFIYIPVFGDDLDSLAMQTFREHAGNKKCVFINARNVCDLGGSLRCLSWQVTGENAEKLINTARTSPPF